jgi:DNA polymerase elongation subunit (family B)
LRLRFYKSVHQHKDKLLVRSYEDGKHCLETVAYAPYVWVPDKDGTSPYVTLQGKPVVKREFANYWEYIKFKRDYEAVHGFRYYGMDKPIYSYIYDNYRGDIDYDPSLLRIVTLDIEVASDDGFPTIELARKEVTAITMSIGNDLIVIGCGDYKEHLPNVRYYKCTDEVALLKVFVELWEGICPDIVTGWNIRFFDIPYMVNRLKNILGPEWAARLSPFELLKHEEIEVRGKMLQTYVPLGVSVLDYMEIFQKFTYQVYGKLQSYSLNFVAYFILGEKKMDYSEYESLHDLYLKDYQKFIEYNIRDVTLVNRIDESERILELIMAIAYDAHVNFEDTLGSVLIWDVIIYNYLMSQRIVIPQYVQEDVHGQFEGAYVKEPKPGMYHWVVSFDLTSLYPHLIMQYNISPETFLEQLPGDISVDAILNGALPRDAAIAKNATITANRALYTKEKKGFLPALMQLQFEQRAEYKKKMLEAEKAYVANPTPENKMLISRYDNAQMAKKIQLNSAYGALGNKYFRYYNLVHAEAITLSAQLSIKWIAKYLNEYLNRVVKTNNVDYVVASDTDSVYLNLGPLVQKMNIQDKAKIVDFLDQVCKTQIEPYISSCYDKLAEYVNAFAQKMKMKRESISERGVWTVKKRYLLTTWDNEGVRYTEPKLNVTGFEAVRSTTPTVCQEALKEAYMIIMTKDEPDLHAHVAAFKEKFYQLPFEEIAFPKGINGVDKYYDPVVLTKPKCPIHVRGALVFNKMIEDKGLTKKYNPIVNKDSIRYSYLKQPNPARSTVIAAPNMLPKELGLDAFIDYKTQYEKSFLDPIRGITSVIGWNTSKVNTLSKFEVDD